MTNFGTRLFTMFKGELVGEDDFGNRYYREKSGGKSTIGFGRERRWVTYQGDVEASKVPADWHAWLHHISKEPPNKTPLPRQEWEAEHYPNLTGTTEAYRPAGHPLKGGQRAKATGDYEAWSPE